MLREITVIISPSLYAIEDKVSELIVWQETLIHTKLHMPNAFS